MLNQSGKLVSVAACLVALGAGVAIGYSPPLPYASIPNESAAHTNRPTMAAADQLTRLEASIAVLRSDIAALNERVARLPQGMNQGMNEESNATGLEVNEVKEVPRSPANLSAQATANAVLDNAIGVGRWTAADRDQLREQFGALATPDKLTLLHKLAEAVNSEQLSVRDLKGPPLY